MGVAFFSWIIRFLLLVVTIVKLCTLLSRGKNCTLLLLLTITQLALERFHSFMVKILFYFLNLIVYILLHHLKFNLKNEMIPLQMKMIMFLLFLPFLTLALLSCPYYNVGSCLVSLPTKVFLGQRHGENLSSANSLTGQRSWEVS